MRPTDILSQEHRVIEQVLACLEAATAGPARFDWDSAEQMLDFFRNFADRCHHGKEEDQLFPALEARGFSRQHGPTAVMRREHAVGRGLMATMTEAVHSGQLGDTTAFDRFARAAREYVQMLRAHIHKEDSCLFPLANSFLRDVDDDDLLRAFDRAEHAPGLKGQHEKYLAVADSLADKFGVKRSFGAGACRVACGCGH
jgi:hemerythrin-like domain-containing protein